MNNLENEILRLARQLPPELQTKAALEVASQADNERSPEAKLRVLQTALKVLDNNPVGRR
jgi:hypothetical protein